MNNFEAIKAMNEKQMEVFLAHVLSTGLNLGVHAAGQENCDFDELTAGCYDYAWLMTVAEPGTRFVFDVDGQPLLTKPLVNAIRINAGITEAEWAEAAVELAEQDEDQLQITYNE